MPLLSASGLSMHFTGPDLFEEVTVAVEPGRKIGLIGRNGSGKTTLLRLLAGELDPVRGTIVRADGVRLGFQRQELDYAPGATVLDEMRGVFAASTRRAQRMHELEEELAKRPGERRLLAEYERLVTEQESAGVFDVERRIASMLTSLGLPERVWTQRVEDFSGGERNVIGLARVLLAEPDVMLLDEPSNHLDMEGVEWFTAFLRRTKAAVVMVSHNRHLLEECVGGIWELERRRLAVWTGNYSAYRRAKAEALALQERRYKTQQREIERLEFQARRLKDMANAYDDPAQAKRARAMLRRIERLDRVEKPQAGRRRFAASLAGAARHGRIALSIRDFSCAAGGRVLFDGANLELEYGERVCLVGPNGSGKTTLFRRLLDEGGWENPVLRLGKSVRAGEYRQLHDVLDPKAPLEEWTARETGLDRPGAARLLHRFLFTRDDLSRPIGTLSGGEKSRLQLARLVHARVNLLLLDEPTNHLDLEACEQLEEMLAEFDGTLFVISHDRWFLDNLVGRVVEVRDRRLVDHACGFSEWWRERLAARVEKRRGALQDRGGAGGAGKRAAREEYEQRRARSRAGARDRARLRGVEERIAGIEAAQEERKRRLAALYEAGERPWEAAELARALEQAGAELERFYAEWEELAARLGE